jgi:hypothetical protein
VIASFSQLKKLCLYSIIAALLLGQAGFSPNPMTARATPNAVGISYQGLDKTHLLYDASACGVLDSTYMWQLRATINSGAPSVLLSGNSFTDTGIYQHTGIPKDALVAYKMVAVLKANNTDFYECGFANASFLESVPRGGTLLFDETLNGNQGFTTLSIGSITVPAGKTLNIGNLTANPFRLNIYGTLQITGPITYPSIWSSSIYYYTPVQLTQTLPASFELYFEPGSEGSVIGGNGTGSTVYVETNGGSPISISGQNWNISAGNVEIHDLTGFYLSVGGSQSTINIRDSEGSFYGGLTGTSQLNITRTKILWGFQMDLTDQSILKMDAVTFSGEGNVNIKSASSNSYEVKNSFLLDRVFLEGSGPGVFSGNEFYSSVLLGGLLAAPTNLTLSDNIFAEQIILESSSDQTNLVIENNSFIGQVALSGFSAPQGSVNIGANYYGDFDGPSMDFNSPFLTSRGAYSDAPQGSWGSWNGSGKFPNGTHYFPSIWLINYVIGQNTIPHASHGFGSPMLQGRKTLVSLDIGVSAETLSGLEVYALLDGVKIDAEPLGSIHRDSRAINASAVEQGKNTVNIILPEVNNGTATLEILADTQFVDGPESGRPAGNQLTLLPATTLSFTVPKSLYLEIVPLDIGGFCTRRVALTADTLRTLTDELPQRFPVPGYLVTVTTRPAYYYFCTPEDMMETFFIPKVLAKVALMSKLGYNPNKRTVIVAPYGSLGSIEGANPWFARGTLVVDEYKPLAVLHELGHSVGLYNDTDQYKLPAYVATGGIPVEGVTAFGPEGTIMIATASDIKLGRLIHFASPDVWWFQKNNKSPVTDIMGEDDSAWPILSTLSTIQSTLFNPVIPTSLLVEPEEVLSASTSQVFLWGMMQSDGYGNYHVIPGSTQVFDITGISSERWRVDKCNQMIPGGNTLYWQAWADGSLIGSSEIGVVAANPNLAPVEAFCRVMYINLSGVNRMTLGNSPQDASLMDVTRSVSLPTLDNYPASGSSLGGQVTLGWTGGSSSSLYWAWFSSDGGVTWQPSGLPVADPSLSLNTGFLPAGNNILIQAFTSDGFQQSMQQIDGLSLANRPPQVSISAPFEGIGAPPGTAWDLIGSAYDLEDGVDITSTWTSSLDGVLGSGNTLYGVTLSPGDHTLTFSATDKAGLSASLQRHVSVGAVTQVDLALAQSSLSLRVDGSDPMLSDPLNLTLDAGHTLDLQVQGAGVPITTTLALFVTAPGGTETLLARQALSIGAFSTGVLQASLIPTVTGEYHIRAAIESSSLPDPNTANNQFTWVYSTSTNLPVSNKIYLPLILK